MDKLRFLICDFQRPLDVRFNQTEILVFRTWDKKSRETKQQKMFSPRIGDHINSSQCQSQRKKAERFLSLVRALFFSPCRNFDTLPFWSLSSALSFHTSSRRYFTCFFIATGGFYSVHKQSLSLCEKAKSQKGVFACLYKSGLEDNKLVKFFTLAHPRGYN